MEDKTIKPPQKTTTSEATQETRTKDKILSIRVDAKTYAAIVKEQTKMGYKSLSSFAVDRLTGKTVTRYTPFNPDIARIFTDVEDSLNYALRLEKRALATPENESDLEDLQAEIQHFKVFVAKKAEALLEKVRDEHFRQTQETQSAK